MWFLNQAEKGQGNVGTYVLTIAVILMSLIIGSMVMNVITMKFLGFSLAFIPDGVDSNLVLSLLLAPFAFMLLGLVLSVKYLHKRPILSVFTSRESFDWKRFFTAFFVWGSIMAIFLIVSIFMGYPIEWNFNSSTFITLTFVSIFLLPIQTTTEEVLFRGYLFQGFGAFFKKGWISILLTGILFGLLHWANPEVAEIGYLLLGFYVWTGIFLGVMTHMDDGLELSMGYHAINNIFAALILTNDWQAFQTDALFIDKTPPYFGWETLLTLLILQPLILLLFSRIYKWKDWRKKMFQ